MFGIGLVIGFLIGVIICYQILYTEIADHLGQYATLKAMGHENRFLRSLVRIEALLLSLLGFGPGLGAGLLLYDILQRLSGIVMALTPARALLVLVLTMLMCLLAGNLAVRKALSADPAELF